MSKDDGQWNVITSFYDVEKDLYEGKVFKQPSKTVVNHNLTPREMLNRYRRGQLVDASVREPIYFGEDVVVPDFETMTLQEQLDYSRDLENYIIDERKRINDLASDLRKKKKAAEEAAAADPPASESEAPSGEEES